MSDQKHMDPVDEKLMAAINATTVEDLKQCEELLKDESNKLLKEDGKEPLKSRPYELSTCESRLDGKSVKEYTTNVFEKELLRYDAMPDTFFAASFEEYASACDAHDLIIQLADQRIPRKVNQELIVLPPLFIRSTKSGTLRFMIEDDNEIVRASREKVKDATIMLLFMAEGAIIPMVRTEAYESFKKLGRGWYSYIGETTPELFARNFEE